MADLNVRDEIANKLRLEAEAMNHLKQTLPFGSAERTKLMHEINGMIKAIKLILE
ncbi:hypothetical protein [Siccibacter colletis]|uniref:hypothetical protein n=1 Tax=Siccibacter colletis TaxID=1505757 RepID=UPI000B0B70CB|nr:hypothetical protein [Siccibacter colletis]